MAPVQVPAPRQLSLKLPDRISLPVNARDLFYFLVVAAVAFLLWTTAHGYPVSADALFSVAQGCAIIGVRKLFPNVGKELVDVVDAVDDATHLPRPVEIPDPLPDVAAPTVSAPAPATATAPVVPAPVDTPLAP